MTKSGIPKVGTKLKDWQGPWPVLCKTELADFDDVSVWLVNYPLIVIFHSDENYQFIGGGANTAVDIVVIDWFEDVQEGYTITDCMCPDLLSGHYFGCLWKK
jgi:hypothetical protein